MGREQFDYAFREYSRRWKFKRPTPSDFFRTMEDASAVDLDWFWRGWFYTTDHVDIAITDVREYQISTQDPDAEIAQERKDDIANYPENITQRRNREEGRDTRVQRFDSLNDFYNEYDKLTVTPKDRSSYQSFTDGLSDKQRVAFERALEDGKYLYFVDFKNIGGLISPLPLLITYEDGETQEIMLPAELWRRSPEKVTKLLVLENPVTSIELDVAHQTADADYSNNAFPPKMLKSRLEVYKSNYKAKNMMSEMIEELRENGDWDESFGEAPVPLGPADNGSDSDETETESESESDDAENSKDKEPVELDEAQKKTLKKILEHFVK